MRTKVTAALSLAGVLVAGSAAALVNTQLLQSSADAGGTLPAVSVPADTGVTSTSAPVLVDASVVQPDVSTQAAYQIGAAGTVVLDTAGDVLTMVSAAPSAGWLVVAAEQPDATQVVVRLQSNTTVVTFRASLLFGVVSTSVETSSAVAGAPAGSAAPGTAATNPPLAAAPGVTVPGGTSGSGGSGGSGGTVTTIDHDDDHDDDDDDDDEEEEEEDD